MQFSLLWELYGFGTASFIIWAAQVEMRRWEYDIASAGLPLLLLSFAVKRLRRELVRLKIAAPYKLIFGSLCIICVLNAVHDRLDPAAPHKFGSVIVAFFFGGMSVVLFWLAYKQRRTSSL
jgi:hypothetical protein